MLQVWFVRDFEVPRSKWWFNCKRFTRLHLSGFAWNGMVASTQNRTSGPQRRQCLSDDDKLNDSLFYRLKLVTQDKWLDSKNRTRNSGAWWRHEIISITGDSEKPSNGYAKSTSRLTSLLDCCLGPYAQHCRSASQLRNHLFVTNECMCPCPQRV